MDEMEHSLRAKAKLLPPNLVAFHDSFEVDRPEECTRVLAGDVPMKLNTFLMMHHDDAMFGWNWTHACEECSKVLQIWKHHDVKNQSTKERLARR